MTSRSTLIAFLLFVVCAHGQEPDFDGKISLRAPARSNWTVTFRPTAAMRVMETQQARALSIDDLPMSPDSADESLARLNVEKSNNIYHETAYFKNGKKTEKWSIGAIQFREHKTTGKLLMAGMNLLDEDFSDRSKEDFEELGWLTKEFYKGVINYEGQPCFLFQTSSEKRPETRREIAQRNFLSDTEGDGSVEGAMPKFQPIPKAPATLVTVIISATTRLPLVYNDGLTLRTYRFETGGLQPLVPPQKFAAEFAAWRAHVAELNRAPAAP